MHLQVRILGHSAEAGLARVMGVTVSLMQNIRFDAAVKLAVTRISNQPTQAEQSEVLE